MMAPPMVSAPPARRAISGFLPVWLLIAGTLLLYAPLLSYVPAYLDHDEIVFSLNAQSIATTGRDVQGRLLPLFFEIAPRFWGTPVIEYTTALVLKILPLSESVVRMPSMLIGVVDVLLVYLVAARIFPTRRLALLAAALLARRRRTSSTAASRWITSTRCRSCLDRCCVC